MVGIEVVNGTVIGPITIMAAVHAPSGNRYGNPRQFETEDEARVWGKSVRDKAIAQVGQDESKRLGFDGKWELRIY